MRLTLEIDLDALGDDAPGEAARILRYWAGAVPQLDLATAAGFPLMDSGYRQVGALALTDADDVGTWLRRYLTRMHEALLWKIDGLGERDARWPRTPTGTNLAGLLKHVASVESEYLGEVIGAPFPEPPAWLDEDVPDDADMWLGPDETVGAVRAFAEQVWQHAEQTLDAVGLDAPAHVPWWGEHADTTVGRILVHVLSDVARHAGHADILRELHDGAAGMAKGNENLPERDAAAQAAYLAELERVAEAAGRAGSGG
jgi:uncharacterized damage-inducible protein DinB